MPIGNSSSGAYNALGVDMKLKRRIEALEQAHNGLCDVLGILVETTTNGERCTKLQDLLINARIDTGDTEEVSHIHTQGIVSEQERREREFDEAWSKLRLRGPLKGDTQEAQDEPQSSKDVSDGRDSTPPMVSTGGAEVESVSVDAIMGELREASTARFIPEVTYSVKRFIDLDVRPHIEKLVGERDEYKKSSNDWARHFKSERTARISAEAEAEKLQKDFNVERNARDRAEELRCDAQAELAQLKRERASGRDWNNLSKALAKAEAERDAMRDILAVIHGDGGHYTEEHGYEKSCADAQKIYYAMRDCVEVLRKYAGSDPEMCNIWQNMAQDAIDNLDEAQKGGSDG